MSKNYGKICASLNYILKFFFLASTITERVSISAFVPLLAVPIGFTSSAIGSKICAMTARIKKYKSIIKKKKRNMIK